MFELALNCRTCFLRMLGLRFACFASLFEDVVIMMSEVMSTYSLAGRLSKCAACLLARCHVHLIIILFDFKR